MAEANRRFHFGLIEAARMPRLSRLVRVLWDATDVYRSLYYSDGDHRDAVHDEHRAVLRGRPDRRCRASGVTAAGSPRAGGRGPGAGCARSLAPGLPKARSGAAGRDIVGI